MQEYCFQLFKPLFCYYFGPLLLKYISRPLSLIFFIYIEGICVAIFFCISGKEHSRSLFFLTLLTQSEERLCLSHVLSLPTHIHNLSLNRRVVIQRLYLNLLPIFLLFLGLMSFLLCADGKEIKSASGLLYFLSVSYLKLYVMFSSYKLCIFVAFRLAPSLLQIRAAIMWLKEVGPMLKYETYQLVLYFIDLI